MRRVSSLVCIATIATLSGVAQPVVAQAPDTALTRLNAVKEGDWRAARPVAEEFAGGAPGAAYAILRREWSGIKTVVARTEIVNAFLRTIHPDGLKVALLGLGDGDDAVRKSAAQGVIFALGLARDLSPEQIRSEIAAREGQTLEQARENRAREIVDALRSATPAAVPGILSGGNALWRGKRLRDVSLRAGLFAALRPHLVGPETTPGAQREVINVLYGFEVPEPILKDILALSTSADSEVVLPALGILGKKRYRPAYDALKKRLVADLADASENAARFRAADALAEFGEPELIPLMIGVIAADNAGSKYDVGYFGLSPLTGVPYNAAHDGEWWKLWWETHRAELPKSVRDLPVPQFPPSPRYEKPMSRETHADREKFRGALLTQYIKEIAGGKLTDADTLGDLGGAAEIPTMIGLIASDNTYNSVYGVGYFGLSNLTGVPYSPLHDGNWWKLWYEAHKTELPESARAASLPEFPRSPSFREPLPVAMHSDPDKLREKLLADLRVSLATTKDGWSGTSLEAAQGIADLKDPRAVPDIIEMMPDVDDGSSQKVYLLDYFILTKLTAVPYVEKHGRVWWRQWWQENKTEFEKRYATTKPAPDFKTAAYRPDSRKKPLLVADCTYSPQVSPSAAGETEATDAVPEDIADTPSVRRFAGGDTNKLYRLVGFDPKAPAPEGGYSLLLMLPGGGGGEDFRWFVQRIKKNALPKNMLVAQLVAPQWGEWQAANLVWPTRKSPFHGMKFSTEEFIEATITDVKRQTKIAPSRVYTMAWSSSGPAVYAHLATKGSSVAGAFIAMSIFRPSHIPDPESLARKRVYLYHSPQDFIKIQQARDGESYLKSHGATVQFAEYSGGHGWHGDIFGAIGKGMEFVSVSVAP